MDITRKNIRTDRGRHSEADESNVDSRRLNTMNDSEDDLPTPSNGRRKSRRGDEDEREDSLVDNENSISARKRSRNLESSHDSGYDKNRHSTHIVSDSEGGRRESKTREETLSTEKGRIRPLSPSEDSMDVDSEAPHSSSSGSGLREMGVSEMNALRAKLGLKPLDDIQPASAASTTNENNLSTLDRVRLAKERRMERERQSKVKKQSEKLVTLGDASDEDDSAASWIEKHKRVLEEKKRAEIQAKQLEETEKEQTEAFDSISGMKVVHDADQLSSDTILVIRDASVLGEGEQDELENLEIVSVEKGKKYAEKMKKKSKYDLYDDDGKAKGILSQYDEEEDEKIEQQKKGFVLGSAPRKSSTASAKKSSASETMEISQPSDTETLFSGETFTFGSRPSLSSDYLASNDDSEVSFAKKKKSATDKTKKKLRQRKVEDEETSGSVLDSLAPVETTRLLTRSDRQRILEEEEDKSIALRQRNFAKYQNALKSASERSEAVFGQESRMAPSYKSRQEEIAARTREMALKQEALDLQAQQEQGSDENLVFSNFTEIFIPSDALYPSESPANDQSLEQSSYYRSRDSIVKKEDHYGETAMEIDESEREAALDIQVGAKPTSSSIGSGGASADMSSTQYHDRAAVNDEVGGNDEEEGAGAADGDDEISKIREASDRLRKARGSKKRGGVLQEEENEPVTEVLVKKEDPDEANLVLPSDEGATSSYRVHQGLGSILSMLQSKGTTDNTGMLAGRVQDQKLQERMSHSSTSAGVPEYYREVEIERKDQWGRDMTSREAFKQFSSGFSGKQSGKRKQEKKFQKFKDQIKQQQQLTDSSIVASLSSVQTAQKKSATPFVVLNSQSVLSRSSTQQQDRELGDTLKSTSSGTSSVRPS